MVYYEDLCLRKDLNPVTKKQSLQRQIKNIKEAYPNAVIMEEVFTGTKVYGRKVFAKLLAVVKEGDTIVFDEISRMSRNEEEGFKLYQELYEKGVNLVFLKEPHLNTETYKQALTNGVELTGTDVDVILEGVNKYLMILAKSQIRLAFERAEKEAKYNSVRTSEAMLVAKANGKRIGNSKGDKLITKKSVATKELIKKHSKDFQGTLTDKEVITLAKVSKNSYYKYKRELINEMNNQG